MTTTITLNNIVSESRSTSSRRSDARDQAQKNLIDELLAAQRANLAAIATIRTEVERLRTESDTKTEALEARVTLLDEENRKLTVELSDTKADLARCEKEAKEREETITKTAAATAQKVSTLQAVVSKPAAHPPAQPHVPLAYCGPGCSLETNPLVRALFLPK